MESVDVLYERIDHIIAISSGKFHNTLSVEPTKILKIAYSDYVKSQLHLNIVTDLFDRPIIQYKKANDFINGDIRFRKVALKVLEYFYTDVINFLRYNRYNVKLELIVDTNIISTAQYYDYNEIKNSLIELSKKQFSNFEEILEYVTDNKQLCRILDYTSNREKIAQKIDSYSIITILLNHKFGKSLSWEVC